MPESPERPPQLDAKYAAFWETFEASRFPMSLIDSDRLYVAVNDATVDLYRLPREQLVGRQPAHTLVVSRDQVAADAGWEILANTGELYNEGVFEYLDGRRLRLRWVAHASTSSGRWLALLVVLSARVEPNGPELIAPAASAAVSEPEPSPQGRPRLTRRELEIVRFVALGASNREIASRLYLSPETVRSHVRNAMSKASARTRAQLVAIALSEQLLQDDDEQTND